MSKRDEDEAWRQIVANYGEQPSVDDLPRLDEHVEEHRIDEPSAERLPGDPERPGDGAQGEDASYSPFPWEDEGRYVPPPPPPVPRPEPRRALAWVGLFGAPIVLLVALVFGIYLPGWVSAILVGGFIGGFVYLVSTMSKDPRDPGDDGAVV
ncbi:hypothetical protein EKO23_11810 [Nocardioides guangzhouensis]|uniref:Uncharacterized protein n=1 Tax=Nocardioides guangzhouensis TaxID=2497878 RepID=A0A4Q4ZCH0_9ACTN|nr:hypothetical protein [Nocardioides guangzhouensis]RYP85683.1 hypothetical protein EKO23_11810 [Nocardioides guangzhouensis]